MTETCYYCNPSPFSYFQCEENPANGFTLTHLSSTCVSQWLKLLHVHTSSVQPPALAHGNF